MEEQTDALYEEMKIIAGGKDYIGSLKGIEIAFHRIPSLNALSHCYNLIELTCKYSKLIG